MHVLTGILIGPVRTQNWGWEGVTHPDQCVEKGKTPVVKHLEG